MPIQDLFIDTLSIYATADLSDGQGGYVRNPTGNATVTGVRGRIEPMKHNAGRRTIADQGDVAMASHVLYLDVADAVGLTVDAHIRDQDGLDFIVVGPPSAAKDAFGTDHVEVELLRVAGAT